MYSGDKLRLKADEPVLKGPSTQVRKTITQSFFFFLFLKTAVFEMQMYMYLESHVILLQVLKHIWQTVNFLFS